MARIHDVVFDCVHPASLARFWAGVLDGYEVAPYDAAELERLRSLGIDGPEDDPGVLVEAAGATPRLFFQRVPEGKAVKNRVHLDLRTEDLGAELERLLALGARRLAVQPPPDQALVALCDPEGNEFCVTG